jgi:dipeptidyl aminopeptidase/acylaminoacyl peptidase
MKPPDLSADAPWKKRFRVPAIWKIGIAAVNPGRGIAVTNKSGIFQLYAWEIESGHLRQLTDQPTGVISGGISPDGEYIYYLHDSRGDETGHYVRVPFSGGDPEDITPHMPLYNSYSIAQSLNLSTLGFNAAGKDGFQMFTMPQSPDRSLGEPQLLYTSQRLSLGPMLSYDGDYAIIATTERSQYNEFTLLAFDLNAPERGQPIRALQDQEATIMPVAFSPVSGDTRFLATTDASGYERPVVWDVKTGDRIDLPLPEIEGNVGAWGWSPDASRLLLFCLNKAVFQLYVYDLERSTLTKLDQPAGSYAGAYYVPGTDEIFANWQAATQPPCVIALDAETGQLRRTALEAGEVPESRPQRSVSFPSSGGVEIQAWLSVPPGDGPFPTILHTHGGPTFVQTDLFDAEAQCWLDHGFAWMSVNYRGSTTFGRDFERAIWGILGHREIDDMAAAYQWLVENGIAQPDAVLLTGVSYGGYLTLQALGRRPDLWAGGMAEVAIADWFLMYEDQAETLRGYLRSLFGGTPDELPEIHRASSPITYAHDISAPVFVIQGGNDTRCPSRQMQVYEQRLLELGKDITVHWFEAGHGSYAIEQSIEHQELRLQFAYRVLG